jgi:hypothetical protein
MDVHIYQVAIFRAALELQVSAKVVAGEEDRFSSGDDLGHECLERYRDLMKDSASNFTPACVRRGTKQSTHPGRFQSGNLPIDRAIRIVRPV